MAHDFKTHRTAFETPWFSVFEKDTWYAISTPSGRFGGGTLIMDSRGDILLVEVYRHPIDRLALEIPRGRFDPGDRDSLATALREAEEETGVSLAAARILDLGIVHPDDGVLAYENRLAAAVLDAPFGAIRTDPGEVRGWRQVAFETARTMAVSGEINDSHTIAALFRLDAMLAQHRPFPRSLT